MKNKALLLFIPFALALSSCTMLSIDVNKAPTSLPHDEEAQDETSKEDPSSPSEEDSSSSSSSETSEEKPDENTSDPTSNKPNYTGLTFTEAKPIINNMINYINSENYVNPISYSHISDYNEVDPNTQVVTHHVIEAKINNELLQYYQEAKETVGLQLKPTVTRNYIYKVENEDKLINATITKDEKSYISKDVTSQNQASEFKNMTGIGPEQVKSYTSGALKILNNALAKAVFDEAAKHGEVNITSTSESNISLYANTHVDKLLGITFDMDIILSFKIEDYYLKYQEITTKKGIIESVSKDRYDYTPYQYSSYPNLEGFINKDVVDPVTPDPDPNKDTSTSEETVNNK